MINSKAIHGVLVVEDEVLIAMLLEDMLEDIGCDDIVLATKLDEGMSAARSGAFSFALLDINLGDKTSFPIADVLTKRQIPFLFASGYGMREVESHYADIPTLHKPFLVTELKTAVVKLLSPEPS